MDPALPDKHYITACVVVQRNVAITRFTTQEFRQSPDELKQLCRFLSKYLLEIIVLEATGVFIHPLWQELDACTEWAWMRPAIVGINPNLARKHPGEQHTDKSMAG